MAKDGELSVPRQPLERFTLEDRLGSDVVERLPAEDEETSVDPPLVELRLLPKLFRQVTADVELAETARRPNRRDCRQLALLAMELLKRPKVHVRDAVAVRDHEFVALDVLARPVDSAAGLRRKTRLREENAPFLLSMERLEVFDATVTDVDADVAVHRAVVEEVVADHVALVAETEDEIHDPEMCVELHDVPEDRPAADLDHRLWPHLRLLSETRSESAAQDHRLHGRHSTNRYTTRALGIGMMNLPPRDR